MVHAVLDALSRLLLLHEILVALFLRRSFTCCCGYVLEHLLATWNALVRFSLEYNFITIFMQFQHAPSFRRKWALK